MWHCTKPNPTLAPALFHLAPLPPAATDGIDHRKIRMNGSDVVAFRHDHDTWLRLRERGLMAPSPMRWYDWPGPYTPMSHQQETAEFFTRHRKCFCLSGLGTGKTLAAIWGMDYLMKQGAVRRAIIIAPLSLCRTVWVRELFKVCPRRKVAFLRGDRKSKQAMAADLNNEILVINPESLNLVQYHLPQVDLIIADEFTKFKTVSSIRYKTLRFVAKERRLWMMSATPAPQSPVDAYGPIKLVDPAWRMTKQDWQARTMIQVAPMTWVPMKGCERHIHENMQPAIRFTREECYDLEPVQTIPIEVELTKKQEKYIKDLELEGSAFIDEEEVTAASAASFFNKAQQIMLGFAYNTQGEAVEIGAGPTMDVIRDLVAASPTPVLVFAPFRAAVKKLQKELTKDFPSTKVITSEVNEKERSNIFDNFRTGEIKVIVAVPSTMSHGLTLIESNMVVWAGAPTSFEIYDQAIGRVARMGQTRQVVNYQIVNHAIGARLFSRLSTREKLQTTLLNLFKNGG